MSDRLLVLVLVLAVASAAVGAGAAILLQRSDDVPATTAQVTVVATTDSDADRSQESSPAMSTAAEDDTAQSASEEPQPADSETMHAEPGEAERPQATQTDDAVNEVAQQPEQAEQSDQPQQALPEQSDQDPSALALESEQADQSEAEADIVATITPNVLTQGEAFALTVENRQATAVFATIGGRSWKLTLTESESETDTETQTESDLWWGILAIPRDTGTGTSEVVIDFYGSGGAWLRSASSTVLVLASAAPFEEIVLGGTGAPPDPAEVQRDISVRFLEHTAVSGPPRWNGPWILPVEGEVSGRFGAKRSYDGVESDEWHHGHDIAAQHGDPIVAPAPGVVVWTGELVLHGMGVILDHGAGVYSGYWHMSLIAVRDGMELASGDWLGNIGTTGLSTGPHLHWEVIIQGIDVDPIQWTGDDQPPLPPVASEPEQATDTLE